jgi:hypothetical protein
MKLLCGVSAHVNGFKSTLPRYLTLTISALTGVAISRTKAVAISRVIRSAGSLVAFGFIV